MVTRRLVYTLALLPLVPSLAFQGALLQASYFQPPGLRVYHGLVATLWVGAFVLIWRSVVQWTPTRKWVTLLIATIPYIQVFWPRAWWYAGFRRSELVQIVQEEVLIGVFTWLAVGVWYGRRQHVKDTGVYETIRPVSASAQAVIASLASVPILFGVFMLTAVTLQRWLGAQGDLAIVFALAVGAVVALLLWRAAWRRAIAWTQRIVVQTLVLWLLLILVPILGLGLAVQQQWIVSRFREAWYLAPVVGWALWMAITIRIWPLKVDASESGTNTPRCLKCGYLLIGLTATRCPECGDEPTLDQLWAAAGELWPSPPGFAWKPHTGDMTPTSEREA